MIRVTVVRVAWYVMPLLAIGLFLDYLKKSVEWLAIKGVKVDVESE